ncbi:uncharacterized protein ColSpa_10764 [Colletotrichum spaethianum]|uniref:Uncharacterized protein n=1 Tax=Colletotrichum spaethianum TaxID=700344 RepID=A0AA37USU9_9PEZI|nr:uncharacterized protein ColSpa_10764 [Colletotrichum spaethianum]GKT50583.1 hypothetical protein ColSpa_10764 [Colletotrichum spaethianum]
MGLGIFDVVGSQRQQGTVFNYARSITWLNFADRLYLTFEAATERIKEQKGLASQPCMTKDDYVKISADCGLAPEFCNYGNTQT